MLQKLDAAEQTHKTLLVCAMDDQDKLEEAEARDVVTPEYLQSWIDRANESEQTIERQRMQLAACSTVTYANTEKSAKAVRDMHPDYRCATVNDVCIAVDREMKLLQTIREISEFAGYEDDGGYVDRHELLAILNRSKS